MKSAGGPALFIHPHALFAPTTGLRLGAQGCRVARLPWENEKVGSFNRNAVATALCVSPMQMTQPRCG
jgi:hypothetical protein